MHQQRCFKIIFFAKFEVMHLLTTMRVTMDYMCDHVMIILLSNKVYLIVCILFGHIVPLGAY